MGADRFCTACGNDVWESVLDCPLCHAVASVRLRPQPPAPSPSPSPFPRPAPRSPHPAPRSVEIVRLPEETHEEGAEEFSEASDEGSSEGRDAAGAGSSSTTALALRPGGVLANVRVAGESLAARGGAPTRLLSGFAEVDEFFGGGFVRGNTVMLSGSPGAGKTTLAIAILVGIGRLYERLVLYVTGEQETTDVDILAERLGVSDPRYLRVIATDSMEEVTAVILALKPIAAVFDSLQTLKASGVEGPTGSLAHVRGVAEEIVRLTRGSREEPGLVSLAIVQITKDEKIAGPKAAEHLVDTVAFLDVQPGSEIRRLGKRKSRAGETAEMLPLSMKTQGLIPLEPGAWIEERSDAPGVVVVVAAEGQQVVFALAQAMVAKVSPTVKQDGTITWPALKRTAVGYPTPRLGLLTGIIAQRTDVDLSGEVFVQITAGLVIEDPGADLGLILAVCSSALNLPVPPDICVFGEVGLGGELRAVPRAAQRLREAARLGFRRAIVPRSRRVVADPGTDIELLAFGTVAEMLGWLHLQSLSPAPAPAPAPALDPAPAALPEPSETPFRVA